MIVGDSLKVEAPHSITELLRMLPSDDSAIAISNGVERVSYPQLRKAVERVSLNFKQLGISKGDRICIWLENSPDWIVCHLAIANIGAVTVPISARFRELEIARILSSSGAVALVTQAVVGGSDARDLLSRIAPSLFDAQLQEPSAAPPAALRFIWGANGDEAEALGVSSIYGSPQLAEEGNDTVGCATGSDTAYIIYTSGTTGKPKGVTLSQQQVIRKGCVRAAIHNYVKQDRMLMLAPLYTVSGGVMSIYTALASHSELVLVPKFSGRAALRALRERACTVIHGVNAVVQKMLDDAAGEIFTGQGIRNVNVGGAPLTSAMLSAIKRVFGGAVTVSYGMSEATGAITYSKPDDELDADYFLTGVGRPMPGVEVRIVDQSSRQEMEDGEIGEIQIRGYLVMKSYSDPSLSTDDVIDQDGWLSSGDLGRIDNKGHLHFIGRIKESYRFNGFNVYPSEVEVLLETNSAVQKACVVPVPDSRFGEIGIAFLELKKGRTVEPSELVASLRDRVAGYKLPAHLHLINELPRAESYKIDRARLLAEALKLHPPAQAVVQ